MLLTSSQNTSVTVVDFDAKRGRFVISCPVWENERVRGMPNRRWDGKGKVWTAPAIRKNIEYIQARYEGGRSTTITQVARDRIAAYTAEQADKNSRKRAFPPYYGFKRKPRAKQLEALEKAYGQRAFALFMDMRTGKTKVFIDLTCCARVEGLIDRVILICPLSLRKNWLREFTKDATIPIDAHLLDTKDKGKAFTAWHRKQHDFKWLLVGVESLAAGSAIEYAKQFAAGGTRVMCAVDESTKIKSHDATRSENAVALARMTEYHGIMTGSPLTKNPLDLYMQFEFLDPDIIGIGDFYSFKARYAVMGGYENREVIGYENLDELIEVISPRVYQVRQDEVFESSKERVLREVTMQPKQAALFKELEKFKSITEIDRELVLQNVLERMLRLHEISGGFVSYLHTEKELEQLRERLGPTKKLPRTHRVPIPGSNPKIAELLACAEEYDGPMIVWCAYRDEIAACADALRREYGEDQVVELHGGVDENSRDVNVNELFQKRKARFCVGNAATGGMGLTMDVATTLVYYSSTFNYIDRVQSEERGTAEGKCTLIVDLVAKGTIDEVVLAAHTEKQDISEYIRGRIGLFLRGGIEALTAGA